MTKTTSKSAMSLFGAAFMAVSISPMASADVNPFSANQLASGYELVSSDKDSEGKCGEGKCGGSKGKEEGKHGTEKAKPEGKCGEGKCGGDMKKADDKRGTEKTKHEGKCGEGKCGGGKG